MTILCRYIFCLFFISCFLFTGVQDGFGQTGKIELLSQQVRLSKNNPDRLTALLRLCEEHESMNKDSLYKAALECRSLAEAQNDLRKKALASSALISAWLRLGKTDSARALIETRLPLLSVKDPALRDVYFKLAGQKVDCFGDASKYEDALSELFSIISYAETYKDTLVLMKSMNTVGVINYNLDHVPDAFKWYFKGLALANGNPAGNALEGALCINLAETYRWVGKTDSAFFYISRAIPLCEKSENLFYLANAFRVKASTYKQVKSFEQAEATMQQCMRIREQTEGKLFLSNEQLALAGIYMRWGKPDKSISILTESLARDEEEKKLRSGSTEGDALKISYYQALAAAYQMKGDSKQYSATLEKLINAKDIFYETNSARAIAELQTRYDVQKKESTIIQQKFDITRKNYLFYGSLVVSFLLALVGWLLFMNYRRRQQLHMDQAVKKEKQLAGIAVKEAEEKERKRIAADLHDNLGAYAASIVSILDNITLQPSAGIAPLEELRNNSLSIVSQLDDTIWVLKKDALLLTAISDRLKVFIQRIQPGHPSVTIDVLENIEDDKLLTPSHAFHLFRIVQEAISNALKHSHCKNILVMISGKEQWMISIEDNGKGIDPAVIENSSNGLLNMKTRARECGWNIEWQDGHPGTVVRITPQ